MSVKFEFWWRTIGWLTLMALLTGIIVS
ncbi:MAG: hypothetical protein V7632_3108, partial [Bradyrhizobium sp.]